MTSSNIGSPLFTGFSNNTVLILNNTVYFGTLICPVKTKSLLRLHGFLLTQLFFQSLKKQHKQRTPCTLVNLPLSVLVLYALVHCQLELSQTLS